jgi:transposase
MKLMNRWRHEALQTGHAIERVVVAYEAGHDGFWLARWLRERGVEAYVMHASSIAVSREHRRAKTDRLDTELLMRAFLGWLRGERRHCSMSAPGLRSRFGLRHQMSDQISTITPLHPHIGRP